MRYFQLKTQSCDPRIEEVGTTQKQLELRITILSSLCNSVFACPVDFTNLAEAKIEYAEILKLTSKKAEVPYEWIKFEVVK